MICTKEEIERKRLAALEKRKSKSTNNNISKPVISNINHTVPTNQSKYSPKQEQHPYKRPKIVNDHSYNSNNNISKNITTVSNIVSGTVYLISESRFEVKPSGFSTPLIDIFKTIPSKNYDSKTKLWSFHVDDHQMLMSKVAKLNPHVVLGGLPAYVLQTLREKTLDPAAIDLTPIEASLRNKLLGFQSEGVKFGISKSGRCMIADDMGLGKTFQALAIASYYRSNWPVLIITTSSMRETWQSKIHELLPSIPMMNIVTLSSNKDKEMVSDKQTEIVIISYKIATTYSQLLKAKKFGVVIIDESHYLKSHKAQCTVAITNITKTAQRIILLSGTPALSRPAELYTQLHILQPHFFKGFTDYGVRYCAGKMTNFGWDMSGQSNLTELQIILQKKFLIRRTKEQVLHTLQDKNRESVILDSSLMDWSSEKRSDIDKVAKTFLKSKSSDKHAALLSFFSESAKVKIPAICKYIVNLLKDEPDRNFLVFAHHRNVIDAICLTLDENNVHYICIVGNTKTDTRQNLVDIFQSDRKCRCAVLSITAANSGLTLTAANIVLFAELHWNPGILVQAESRAHRIGQERNVCVRYLLAKCTSDDFMWPMLQNKLNVLNQVGLSGDTFEDATLKIQESENNILKFLTPSRNKNEFIEGTNIRKCFDQPSCSSVAASNTRVQEELDNNDKSLLDDEEGDELLANIDF